ncbi:MAG: TIGR00289 family protein [Nitrososphaerota archaeon]|nr:TIGR00289 family protein [Nitrososphaerota archaeon]MDG6977543.1 TIGR00289 family protein [Nitrososphaerota archaeon]
MRVGVLFSGGKDSTYAAYLARRGGEDLRCLITLFPSRPDSYMFHYPNLRLTRLQAEAMHLPQVTVQTKGVKEEELGDLKDAIATAVRGYSVEVVYTGALASIYQKSRVERVCEELGVRAVSPLWHVDQVAHLEHILTAGFKVIVTGAAALGLDESWLGRQLDQAMVADLARLHEKYRINPALEGGEGETFVLDCPLFDRRIDVVSSKKHWNGDSGYLEILEARLIPKE